MATIIALEKSLHLIGVANRAGIGGNKVLDLVRELAHMTPEAEEHFLALFVEAVKNERARASNRAVRLGSRR